MGTVTILPETTNEPLVLMGQMAGVCWGADTESRLKNWQRGWECVKSGHGRVCEYPDVYMLLNGYSARVMREWYTHIGGMPTRLQASTRYIDYTELEYVIPPTIASNPDALEDYNDVMRDIARTVEKLESFGIPREDAAMLLPLGMCTRVVCKHNLRNLIDMSRQRMCSRAYWEYRELFNDIREALSAYSDEWDILVNTQMYPKCKMLGYCPEKNGCGKYPKRGEERAAD